MIDVWVAPEPMPDSATLMMWRMEAARAGFTGEQCSRLAFWRWLAQVDRAGLGKPVDEKRMAFLNEIRNHFGTPYVFGAKGPLTFDCSGLLTYCGRQVGLDLGDPDLTSADGLKQYCESIPMTHAAPGDLYLFSQTYGSTGPDYATHCGAVAGTGNIYMLDDHGDPWPGCGNTDITTPYWQQHLMGAWRPIGYDDSEEDPALIAELQAKVTALESQLGYLTKDVAAALQSALTSARVAKKAAQRTEALDSIQAAIDTLSRGGS